MDLSRMCTEAQIIGTVVAVAVLAAGQSAAMDVQFKTSARQTYDDNVTASGQNTGQDFITSLAAGLVAKQEYKTGVLSAEAALIHYLYADYNHLNYTEEKFNILFTEELTARTELQLRGALTHSEEPGSLEESFGRPARYAYYETDFSARLDHAFTQRFGGQAQYRYARYDVSRRDLTDSYLNRGRLAALFAVTPRWQSSVGFEIGHRVYSRGSDITQKTVALGSRYQYSPTLKLDATTGTHWFETNYKNRTDAAFFYRLTATEELTERTTAAVSWQKESTIEKDTSSLFDAWRLSGNLNHEFSSWLAAGVNVFYGDGEFDVSGITESFYGLRLDSEYELMTDIKALAAYIYTRRNASAATRNYERNRISVGITAVF
ncbi:MAG: outer membrane beta-barrel protein [Candidatus Omnitrophica bacterium]|nr:outer membrane beta-barrel protein [Candidatus Omnitrophota bacterium]